MKSHYILEQVPSSSKCEKKIMVLFLIRFLALNVSHYVLKFCDLLKLQKYSVEAKLLLWVHLSIIALISWNSLSEADAVGSPLLQWPPSC